MRLSELVFLSVKNVNYFDDDSMTYNEFMQTYLKGSDNYTDYSVAISNVFTPLNEAIARLSDLEKIPYKVVEVAQDKLENMLLNIKNLGVNIKEVISVARSDTYEKLPFAPYGVDKIRLLRPHARVGALGIYIANDDYGQITYFGNASLPLILEYKEEIPTFDKTFIDYVDADEDNEFDSEDELELNPKDKDMSEYGINGTMCQYIIEYCQGKLEEQIAPDLALMHLTRAEQYFNNLSTVKSAFVQQVVHKKYTIM